MADGKFVAYYRVSTAQQGHSGLGLEAQRDQVMRYLSNGGWPPLAEFTEIETGKGANALDRRPQLQAALAFARKHKATLIIAKLDRLDQTPLQQACSEYAQGELPKALREKLEKQAEVAQQYRALQEQGTLKLHQFWFLKHRDAAAEEQRVHAALLEAGNALEARLAELRHVEAELETVRQSHYAAGDSLHQRQGELAEAALEVSRLEERIRYVVDPGLAKGDPHPMVMTEDRQLKRLSLVDFPTPPVIAGRRYRSLSSSEPNRCNAGVAMSVCTPMAIGTPPQAHSPSASAITIE